MKKLIAVILVIILYSVPAKESYAVEGESGSGAMIYYETPEPDNRVELLSSFLRQYNSPVDKYAGIFISEADRLNIDWKLVVSIAGLESTFCRNIPIGSFNCWGWGIPDSGDYRISFRNFPEGIKTVSEGLKFKYIDQGLLSVEQIGTRYASSPTWAFRVRSFMRQIDEWDNTASSKNLRLTI